MQATLNRTEPIAIPARFKELLPVMQWVDRRLERALASAQVAYGSAEADPYRGLHLTQEDVEQLLQRNPGVPPFPMDAGQADDRLSQRIGDRAPLGWLQQTFGLSDFELEVVAIALAPELDRRYERLYAYLQEDMTCKRPSVDLVFNLLCDSGAAKLWRRAHFAPDAPLLNQQLVYLVPDPNQVQSTLLAHSVVLDEQIVGLLLGQPGLDSRLAPFCQSIQPTITLQELLLNADVKQALAVLVAQHWQRRSLRLYFEGIDGATKRRTAEALANEVKAPLLVVDLARMGDIREMNSTLKLLFRAASFQNALLYIQHLEGWQDREHTVAYLCLLEAIAAHSGITILAGVQPWAPAVRSGMGIMAAPFGIPDFNLRQTCWKTHLRAAGVSIEAGDLNTLVDCFSLTPDQIADTVTTACNTARWQAAADGIAPEGLKSRLRPPTVMDIYAAARAQSGQELKALAQKIEPKHTLEDIVLPADPKSQLSEICYHVKYRSIVHRDWGFDRKLSLGKGLNVLFYGSPGTGKTMASEALAHELQLDLYKIDLSQVVSKYIGETEKSLNRIFAAADNANAILLFDEADALFGKRSEVKDAHDRYANLEVAYLLQKMEEYEGMTILTTNLRQNLDQAFTRRIRFIVGFPLPTEEHRLQIWKGIWPKETPLATDVDFKLIAQRFELTGGNIRNIALAAAFLAAVDGERVGMQHLLQATKREFQKMGRLINEIDFSSAA